MKPAMPKSASISFGRSTAPHCLEAHPFVSALFEQHSWLLLEERELSNSADNALLYQQVAAAVGEERALCRPFSFAAR